MTVEDRLRATTGAVAATMRPVRPLDLQPGADLIDASDKRRQRGGWQGWLIPLTAGMAVIAVAATLVAVRGAPSAKSGSGSTPAASGSTASPSSVVPPYYVALGPNGPNGGPEPDAVLADTSTGKQLATFKGIFTSVAASADDKIFVLFAGEVGANSWYVLRLPPGAPQQARLTSIPIAPLADSVVAGFAVSPDGSALAVLFGVLSPVDGIEVPSSLAVRTYSLATGQVLRTWSAPASALHPIVSPFAFSVSWLNDGSTLAFMYASGTVTEGVRFLNTTAPGTNLLADSQPVFSAPAGGACESLLPTLDGKSVICGSWVNNDGSCAKGQVDVVDMTAYNLATGKSEGVLYRYQGNCNSTNDMVQVMWAESDTLVMGATYDGFTSRNLVGVMTPGKFTPLPFSSIGDFQPGSIAF